MTWATRLNHTPQLLQCRRMERRSGHVVADPQRLPQLFQALLEGYFSYTATEDQLEQAKSWYNQMMDSAEKGKAFEQAIMPAQMLSQVPYFSRDERRKILPSITLKEVLAYRDALKSGARPEFMVIGNMTEAQATTLARDCRSTVAA